MHGRVVAGLVLSGVIALGSVAACGKNQEPPPPTSGSPNAQPESGPKDRGMGGPAMTPPSETTAAAPDPDRAKKMYGMVCAMCHGADGTGNGAAAAKLDPKPRDYTDAAWQASVTDEELKKIILLGGIGVGKSPMMPAQPQLKDQPEVLEGLVKIIRDFGKK